MKCQAKTKHGTRCKRDAWMDYPMCTQHIEQAYRYWMREKCGDGAELWSISNRNWNRLRGLE